MSVRVLVGDVRAQLALLADDTFDCVVTSPPYYGLRDYGTAEWQGGDAACAHMHKTGGTGASTLGEASGGHAISDAARVKSTTRSFVAYRDVCGLCGAVRVDGQIGLEATPAEHIAVMIAVFREVRRVLKPTGTLWLNLGDSYAGGGNGGHQRSGPEGDKQTLEGRRDRKTPSFHGHKDRGIAERHGKARTAPLGLKPKDLMMMPARIALALQDDGWWLRSEMVWGKPNPMPESVTDRPATAHEKIFLLAKSGRTLIWRARDTREWSSAPDLAERIPWPTREDPDATVARWRGFDYFYDADAVRQGRDATLIELNPAYADIARRRIAKDAGMFADLEAAPA